MQHQVGRIEIDAGLAVSGDLHVDKPGGDDLFHGFLRNVEFDGEPDCLRGGVIIPQARGAGDFRPGGVEIDPGEHGQVRLVEQDCLSGVGPAIEHEFRPSAGRVKHIGVFVQHHIQSAFELKVDVAAVGAAEGDLVGVGEKAKGGAVMVVVVPLGIVIAPSKGVAPLLALVLLVGVFPARAGGRTAESQKIDIKEVAIVFAPISPEFQPFGFLVGKQQFHGQRWGRVPAG